MYPMMDFYKIAKQRHEEILRQATQDRLARALREDRKRRAGKAPVLVWELKRGAGRLWKFLRASKNANQRDR